MSAWMYVTHMAGDQAWERPAVTINQVRGSDVSCVRVHWLSRSHAIPGAAHANGAESLVCMHPLCVHRQYCCTMMSCRSLMHGIVLAGL